MTIKQVTVAQHERALVWKNKTFAGVLELTVFGGLDGVLKDVVRIQVPAN